MTRTNGFLFLSMLSITFSVLSCKTPQNIYYAKELIDSTKVMVIPQSAIPVAIIQPYDLLLITTYGKGLDMTMMVNNYGGLETVKSIQSSGSAALNPGYLVSPEGFIELPQLGKLKVAGLTLAQLKANLTERYAKIMIDPNVVVKFTSFKVTMLGEVKGPGTVTTPSEKMNIFEALGLSGDVTINGVKEKVKIFRTQDTTTTIGVLDLTSKDVFKSDYFYLKPNDVVYVPSNGLVQKQQRVNTLFPFVSIALSLISVIIAVTRK